MIYIKVQRVWNLLIRNIEIFMETFMYFVEHEWCFLKVSMNKMISKQAHHHTDHTCHTLRKWSDRLHLCYVTSQVCQPICVTWCYSARSFHHLCCTTVHTPDTRGVISDRLVNTRTQILDCFHDKKVFYLLNTMMMDTTLSRAITNNKGTICSL